MVVKTSDQFFELLTKSNVLDEPALQRAKHLTAGVSNVKNVARQLMQEELLTRWQAANLLAGKSNLTIGKYRLLGQIGGATTGTVFLAEHAQMHRRVALKALLHRDHSPQATQKFLKQARTVSSLEHPNLTRAYDIDIQDQYYYLVLEYVEGRSVEKILETQGRMNPYQVAQYIRQAADALAYAQEKGLLHRDIRPANLMISNEGELKILNLGVVKLSDPSDPPADDSRKPTDLDHANYLSPEQARGSDNIDARSDLYSLGCVMFAMLTGEPPFEGRSYGEIVKKHQSSHPKKILDLNPELDRDLAKICLKLLGKKREDRFQSASQLVKFLEKWLQSNEGTAAAIPPVAAASAAPAPPREPVAEPAKPAAPAATGNGKRAASSRKAAPKGMPPVAIDGSLSSISIAVAAKPGPSVSGFAIQTDPRRKPKGKPPAAAPAPAAAAAPAVTPAAKNKPPVSETVATESFSVNAKKKPPAAAAPVAAAAPAAAAPAVAATAQSDSPATPTPAAKGNSKKMLFIIGGAVGGGVLALGLVIGLVMFLFSGGDDPEVAALDPATDPAAAVAVEAATPEADPAAVPEEAAATEVDPNAALTPEEPAAADAEQPVEAEAPAEEPAESGAGGLAALLANKPAEPAPTEAAPAEGTPAEAAAPGEAPAGNPAGEKPAETPKSTVAVATPPASPNDKRTPAQIKEPLKGLSASVDLPVLALARSDQPAQGVDVSISLGKVFDPPDDAVFMEIAGTDQLARGNVSYKLERELASAVENRKWTIVLESERANEAKIPLAEVAIADFNMSFRWLPGALEAIKDADILRNCMLEVTIGKEVKRVGFRTPAAISPIETNLSSKSIRGSFEVENLPPKEFLKIKVVQLEGFPDKTALPSPFQADGGKAMINVGPPAKPLLGLEVKALVATRNANVIIQPYFDITGTGGMVEMNAANQRNLANYHGGRKAQADAALKPNSGATGPQKEQAQAAIEDFNKALNEGEQLKQLMDQLSAGGKIHYQVIYTIGSDRELVVASSLATAAEEPAPAAENKAAEADKKKAPAKK